MNQVTQLLQAWAGGDTGARDRLMPLVYEELRRRAASHLRRERQGHTLQPTALVHEAYLRLIEQDHPNWRDRAQFFHVASQMMRRLLVDRARARRASKRSGLWIRLPLEDLEPIGRRANLDALILDEALTRLARLDPRKSQIAELRFFGGLSLEETGQFLGVSRATVERDWQVARAWLFSTLSAECVRDDA